MVSKIVPILERIPHRFYCEPFGGGASILMNKGPVDVETYNDLDSGLYNFFMVLADIDKFAKFKRRVEALPYSRDLYNQCRASWADEPDIIKRVAMWFVVARQSFSGSFGASWSSAVAAGRRGMAMTCSTWLSCLDKLPDIHNRLQRVQIENSDWRIILDRYDTPDTLFYLDPPYIPETRSAGNYCHELTSEDHVELVDKLLSIQGKAALSGYSHPIYKPLDDAGWACHKWETACYAVARTRATGLQGKGASLDKQPRTECLWVKPYEDAGMLF